MKKYVLLLFISIMVMLSACEKEKITVESEKFENVTSVTDKIAVINFSVTNNTKRVSEKINEYLATNNKSTDVIAIEAKEPYTDNDIKYGDSNSRANKEQTDDNARPKIVDINVDFNNYDTIFLGYPIWHGTFPKVILTFLEKYDLNGKTIIPFCTSESSGIGTSDKDLQKYTKAIVKSGKRFPSRVDDKEVIEWVKELGY